MGPKIELFTTEDDIFEKVANKFDKTGKELKEDVIALQKWLETQPHLPKLLDSHSLQNFLLLNKGSVEKTKEKIDRYYTIRSKLPEIFDEINPKLPYNREFDDMLYMVPSPQRNEQMHTVGFIKAKNPNLLEKFDPISLIKQLITIQEIRLREDNMYGEVFVIDGKDVPLSVVLKFTPTIVYRGIVLIYKEVFSLRVKGLYIINFPPYAEVLLNLFKSIVTPKIRERIHIFPDLDSLAKVVPLKILPKEFGGEGLSLEILQEALKAKRLEHQDLFDRLDEARVDESLRPEKLKNDDFYGFYGNFKKLNID